MHTAHRDTARDSLHGRWLALAATGARRSCSSRRTPLMRRSSPQPRRRTRRRCAQLSADANRRNTAAVDGTTALHWAVQKDALEIVDALLDRGREGRMRPTATASRRCRSPAPTATPPSCQRLLKAGAYANAPLPGGETMLMTAARTGKVDVMKALLAYGADPNARETTRGQTRAHVGGGRKQRRGRRRRSLEAGADMNATRPGAQRAPRRPAGSDAARALASFSGAVGGAATAASCRGTTRLHRAPLHGAARPDGQPRACC